MLHAQAQGGGTLKHHCSRPPLSVHRHCSPLPQKLNRTPPVHPQTEGTPLTCTNLMSHSNLWPPPPQTQGAVIRSLSLPAVPSGWTLHCESWQLETQVYVVGSPLLRNHSPSLCDRRPQRGLQALSTEINPRLPEKNRIQGPKKKTVFIGFAYLRGMNREEWVAPIPGRPCFTGL